MLNKINFDKGTSLVRDIVKKLLVIIFLDDQDLKSGPDLEKDE